VRVRAGIAPRPLLTRADLPLTNEGAGLVIAGSYVPKTSAQLEHLFQETEIEPVEVKVERLLDPERRAPEIKRVGQAVNQRLARGQDTAVYTSRRLISTDAAEDNLVIGRTVSDSLVAIARGLKTRPRYLLAKGGITSSDIATQALGIRRTQVLGQILPGVPVWLSGPESCYPGLVYIVFPGNVGDADALASTVQRLKPDRRVFCGKGRRGSPTCGCII